jgi:hypothetical protein
MSNKKLISITLMVIIGCSLIIIVPIQIISIRLSSYDTINKSCTFIYQPSSPSSIENLYLNVDEGNVEIRYIDPSVDYYALIEVDIELIGKNLAGKSYEDYLNISWYNSSSLANFRMEIISDDWFNPSLWLIKDVSIIVTLRKDIVFDIITNLIKGNYKITVPWPVSIGNLLTNVSNGNILYDFELCSIQGNITGITNKGDLVLKSHNVEYNQNCNWLLTSTAGDMNIEIYQEEEMGANITGTAMIIDGILNLFYEDNSANIGANFFFPLLSGNLGGILEGFYTIFESEKTWFISFDFPTINNYNLTLYITNPSNRCRNIELHSD